MRRNHAREGPHTLKAFSYGLDLGFFKSLQLMLKRLYGGDTRIGEKRGKSDM
jgi:hypothetical protein